MEFRKPDSLKERIFAKKYIFTKIMYAHCCSVTKLCPTLSDPMDCSMPGFRVLHYLPEFLKFMSIESVMLSSHLLFCLSFLLLTSIFPSIQVFSNESTLCIRWPNYWSFSFSISPFNEYSGLISFRIDWFDLLAVQGSLKSLLQHHSSKASVFQCCLLYGPALTSVRDYLTHRSKR